MEFFKDYLNTIDQIEQRDKMESILNWINKTFPNLEPKVAWNQPNFTDHGTFILGLSASKHHISIAPEQVALERFKKQIHEKGYHTTKELIHVKEKQELDFNLLKEIIQFNINDKKGNTTYWRK